ncbi:hypothetical protein [Jeotgalibacillus haloalkalitolerans]|uniref:Uncharacterized protein n=1 Tax=Jeotgalibacillus haloalkalitolerans TaxID=3104292 RepID=A0ABU5KNU8_9BACL|nr:hypothetical protein [Jeotgalibacillus sp. HH7-29]MDZ5712631.1 hypothetical protein [Jeotgalibacillus sp. HH7-29]
MKAVKIGSIVIIPFMILFLMFSTWIGYIAENIRDFYNFKWLAIAGMITGYILQFYKMWAGVIVIAVSIFVWFLL